MFGHGQAPNCRTLYRRHLRASLSEPTRMYWDRHIGMFSGKGRRPSFYFHGTSGILAWMINVYIDRVAKVRNSIDAILDARSLDEQRQIYDRDLQRAFWTRFLRWSLKRNTTMFLAGVPREQRHQVEKYYPGGLLKFIQDRVETVFTKLPLHDNYFWRVYLEGSYSRHCCPEYLKAENFELLKQRVDRISTHTCSILDFLRLHQEPISRFVLLDHMDWLSAKRLPVLHQQWQALVDKAAPRARMLWRSGALRVDYVDPIEVQVNGRRGKLGDFLHYHSDLAAELHQRDRVHTYGSFYIADLNAN
jgi:S-adenosylmethionine-diacylglycerol 3-amino-3-carboxypropyl transferase